MSDSMRPITEIGLCVPAPGTRWRPTIEPARLATMYVMLSWLR